MLKRWCDMSGGNYLLTPFIMLGYALEIIFYAESKTFSNHLTIKNVLPQLRQRKMKGMDGIGVPPLLGLRLLIHKYDNTLFDINVSIFN